MDTQANKWGVEIIDISRFLNMMGWKAQDRTTSLGGRKTASKRSSPSEKPAAAPSEDAEEEPADKKPAAKPATPGAEDEDPFGK
jgi:hypothetical protein